MRAPSQKRGPPGGGLWFGQDADELLAIAIDAIHAGDRRTAERALEIAIDGASRGCYDLAGAAALIYRALSTGTRLQMSKLRPTTT